MTLYYGNYAFDPYIPGGDIIEIEKAEYWQGIAEEAVLFFSAKEDFMEWVCTNYFLDDNRFAADMAWDLVKIISREMDCE